MEYLLILYFIDLTFGSVGQGRVSRNDLATWLMISKPTVDKRMAKMVADGLVTRHEISALKGHGFIIKWSMTVEGKQWLDDHYDAAYEAYKHQVAKVMRAVNDRNKVHEEYRKLSAKEKRQIEAGQKEMF